MLKDWGPFIQIWICDLWMYFCCSFLTRSVLHVHASLIYILRLPFIYYFFYLMSPYQIHKNAQFMIINAHIQLMDTNHTSLQISCNIVHVGAVILMYTGKGFSWLVHDICCIEAMQVPTFSNHINVDMGCPVLVIDVLLIYSLW